MIVALIDNGSLEPAAHRNLRAVARALSARAGLTVHAVSWKHSDRIPAAALDGTPAWTLADFVRALHALGQHEFLFVPFFISAQGAIGSALRQDLDELQRQFGPGSLEVSFAEGLAASQAIPAIVADRIRSLIAAKSLSAPPVIVVDHGGPSPASALLRDELAAKVRTLLGREIGPLAAASMEGEAHAHNRPLLADQLGAKGFDRGDVIIAPLFLSPGRHAGPTGDLAQIAGAAEDRLTSPPLCCHFTDLVGTHPLAIDALTAALHQALAQLHAPSLA
jgi:sirohydrochlorin ferrochelatase